MITIPRKELVACLGKANAGVCKREGVAQGDSFVFKDGHVHAYNDEIAVHVPLPDVGPGIAGLVGAVEAKRLLSLVKAWGGDNLSFKVKAGKELTMKGDSTRVSLRLQPDIILALGNEGNPDAGTEIIVDPKYFVEALKTVMVTAAMTSERVVLNAVHIGANEQGTYAEASDGQQLSRYYFSRERLFTHEGWILPLSSCKELVQFAPTQVSCNSAWVHFVCDDAQLALRRVAGAFPDLQPFITAPADCRVEYIGEGIDASINRAALAAGTAGKLRWVRILGKTEPSMVLRIEGTNESDWIKEIVPGETTGDFDKLVGVDMLREALRHSTTVQIGEQLLRTESESSIYAARFLVFRVPETSDKGDGGATDEIEEPAAEPAAEDDELSE